MSPRIEMTIESIGKGTSQMAIFGAHNRLSAKNWDKNG